MAGAKMGARMVEALAVVMVGEMTANAAAKEYGVTRSALYKAVWRRRNGRVAAVPAGTLDGEDPRIHRALRYVADGATVFDAARRESLNPSDVHRWALAEGLIEPGQGNG